MTLFPEQPAPKINYGYWQVDGKRFFEKIECLQYASKIKNYNVTYHCFDQEYSSFNWADDTYSVNLDELYKRRAQQIRDKYNYVMVAFSGGSDSRNILDTFLENNIHIDEIVSYYPIRVSDKLLSNFDINNKSAKNNIFEYYLACQPTLKEISAKYPNIKITIIDYTEPVLDIVANDQAEKLVKYGTTLGIYNAGERILSEMLKTYSEKYNNACCVYGIDKPSIRFDFRTDRMGFCISDFSHNKCRFVIDGYQPVIEPFYTTPDMPEIFFAQSQAIKRYLMPLIMKEPTVIPSMRELFRNTNHTDIKIIESHCDVIKSILYKNFNPTIYQTDKPRTQLLGQDSDAWFHETGLVDKKTIDYFVGQYKNWSHGIDERFITRDEYGYALAWKPYSTKTYWC
jgi:hypothetical protein